MKILHELEHKDFIEIIDDNDGKNWTCRFRRSFLRETLYQRMLYRAQKQMLH